MKCHFSKLYFISACVLLPQITLKRLGSRVWVEVESVWLLLQVLSGHSGCQEEQWQWCSARGSGRAAAHSRARSQNTPLLSLGPPGKM